MSKRFIHSINYMRGICMLGVIAIHVGSVALLNPTPNLELVAVLEILSRFSVPTFFFLSAFGMFMSQPVEGPFVYKDYLKRRLRTVLVPYVAWSLFYMTYSSILSHNLYTYPLVWPGHVSHLFSRYSPLVLFSHAFVARHAARHESPPLVLVYPALCR